MISTLVIMEAKKMETETAVFLPVVDKTEIQFNQIPYSNENPERVNLLRRHSRSSSYSPKAKYADPERNLTPCYIRFTRRV